jgi:hypothetical protein
MDSIPASSRDIYSIRTLGNKHENQLSFDFTDDKKFLKRYFTKYFNDLVKDKRITEAFNSKHRTESSKYFFSEKKICNGKMDNV